MLAKVVKWTGLVLGVGVGLAGGIFAAGYAFTDWPLAVATAATALWVVPMVVLSVHALRRPESARRVLLVAAAGVTLFAVVDAFFDVIPSDDWGPVVTVMDLALVVAVSFLAVRRTGRAGKLLVAVALVQLVALVVNVVMHETGVLPPGPGFANAVVVLWMLVVGALFLVAGTPERGSLRAGPDRTPTLSDATSGTRRHDEEP
jgi:amino acid transporter